MRVVIGNQNGRQRVLVRGYDLGKLDDAEKAPPRSTSQSTESVQSVRGTTSVRQAVPSTSTLVSSSAQPKSRWVCRICRKGLSSKRSYDEHMNIHNQARPFLCEHCDYAASSQMTLRRHKLRYHTPRTDWGYQCPYCIEAYMEPASYQQHVLGRHPGRSATFGCPLRCCPFSSKCSRHFREHLAKHENIARLRRERNDASINDLPLPEEIQDRKALVKFLVNDENGFGYGNDEEAMSLRAMRQEMVVDLKAPLQLPNTGSRQAPRRPRRNVWNSNSERDEQEVMPPDEDWIEAEVVVESEHLPDGTVDFELD